MSTSLPVSLLTHWQAFCAPRYPHDNVLDASVNYNRVGDDYLDYQRYTPFADTPEFEYWGSESSFPRAQASSVTGGPYLGGQYSTTERNHNLSLSDGERPGFQDSEVANRPHGGSFGVNPCSNSARATPIFSDEVAVVGRTNTLLSLQASAVGSQGTIQASTEPLPVGVNNPESNVQAKGSSLRPQTADARGSVPDAKHNGISLPESRPRSV
jgi:hypothetical protein